MASEFEFEDSLIDTNSILIVDDGALTRELVSGITAYAGFSRIDTAASGPEALQKLAAYRYWLVLSDLKMTPMDGVELLEHVRGHATLKSVKFIIMTSQNNAESVLRAKRAGADAVLLKPFSVKDLEQVIRDLSSELSGLSKSFES